MRYKIHHSITYTYSQPVSLEPHLIRLRPRCNGDQSLESFLLEIRPDPVGKTQLFDPEGNALVRVWFKEPTDFLQVSARSAIATTCANPFQYLLEPWATHLPIPYPAALLSQLHPYFYPLGTPQPIDGTITSLATEISHQVDGQVVAFLGKLNQHIHDHCQYQIRETGAPQPASITWKQATGSCRDLAVLFIEACRAVGLAARFVSGYQEGDPDSEVRDLHAWAEVYLPGAGWRGYDPTQGLAVADRHIALVAHPLPRQTTPVAGIIRGNSATSEMKFDVSIQPLSEVSYSNPI